MPDNVNATEHANPTPAVGQVWRGDVADVATHVIIAVTDTGSGYPYRTKRDDGLTDGLSTTIRTSPAWKCIGIDTPHGRVMVGERRAPPQCREHVYEILSVTAANMVRVQINGVTYEVAAHTVAHWPIVRDDAKPNPYREPAQWDRVSIGGVDVPYYRRTSAEVVPATATLTMHDPRAARERIRHEIDLVLRDDARRFPAFAAARKNAATAVGDRGGDANEVRTLLRWLHEYERQRGGMTRPREEADGYANVHFGKDVQRAYERARGM